MDYKTIKSSSDKNSNSLPIGIFDSGFGGLTVMRAILSALPHEDIIYVGDTARLPYGNKSAETIIRYSLENVSFLVDQGIKLLVVACHTACTQALSFLKEKFTIPIVGVIEPAVLSILRNHPVKIAVLGTLGTIASGMYQREIREKLPSAELTAIACPLFVPLVEEGYCDHPLTHLAAREYLEPLKRKNIDSILLGCTHYPLLSTAIQKQVGANVSLIDPGVTCAEYVKQFLTETGKENGQITSPHYQFYVSDDPQKFCLLGETFLSRPIEECLLLKT